MLSRADSFLLEQEQITGTMFRINSINLNLFKYSFRTFSNHHLQLYLEQQQKGRGNKKSKKKKKARPHARAITEAQAAQNLCGGYYKVWPIWYLFAFWYI